MGDFGSAYKTFSQPRTLLSPVTVEAMEMIKSLIQNVYDVLHVWSCLLYCATNTPLLPMSWLTR